MLFDGEDVLEAAHAEDVIHVLIEVSDADRAAVRLGLALELHKEPQAGRRDIVELATIDLECFVRQCKHLFEFFYLIRGCRGIEFTDKTNTRLLISRKNRNFHIIKN